MSNTDESQSQSSLHVSLTKWSTVKTTIPSVNEAYSMSLDVNAYEDRLAFRNDKGYLTLELYNVNTGTLDWVIVDRESSITLNSNFGKIENPKAFAYKEVINNFDTIINTETELAFLADCRLDVRYDSGIPGNLKAFNLMSLLNNYGIGHGWTCNPSNGCTTAYFVPRYYGTGADAPDVYNFNRDAKLVCVVELMMYGEYQLHALVVR